MKSFTAYLEETGEFGVVDQVLQSSALIAGLPGASLQELVLFETGQIGEVFVLEKDSIQVLLFSRQSLRPGTRVVRTNQTVSVPVGKELLGTVIDPLGNPISKVDDFEKPKELRAVDNPPPGMVVRSRIDKPLLTGISVVDLMMPLGKGQKELIIGDRNSGKTLFLLSTIKNQVKLGTVAIYAGIARKKSDIKLVQEFFAKTKIANDTIIVATTSYDAPGLIYQTPYSAMAIAEHFRDEGKDVLLVLDDLSTHAKFYREIALLSKRFPGRDSYPGDIFHTHAKLLERAGNFKTSKGDVSISVLPVIEITEGDFTGYIPTNVMSMTDGHLFFDANVFAEGRRPAVNLPLSVTRVGRQAQTALLRNINNSATALLSEYEKVKNLTHFGAELTDDVKGMITKGDMIYKLFNQPGSETLPIEISLALFGLVWTGSITPEDALKIPAFRQSLLEAWEVKKYREMMEELTKEDNLEGFLKKLNQKTKEELLKICKTNKS